MLKLFFTKQRSKVHFLHIGKTGGTAIKSALKDNLLTPKYNIKLQGHKKSLSDIPNGDKVIFFLRDPMARFISGFYSRQRKGKPRYYSEWNSSEKEIFETFTTPNQLAVALANENSKDFATAIMAMKSVQHFSPYKKWYGTLNYFKTRLEDILFIGFQESLERDFTTLKTTLGLPESLSLPTDSFLAHKNPANLDKSLEEQACLALSDWYAEDFEFINLCKKLMTDDKTT